MATKTEKAQAPAQAAPATTVKFEVVMSQDKVTKNAVRYKELHATETEPDRIGQLYLQKHNFPNGAPQEIRVQVETLS